MSNKASFDLNFKDFLGNQISVPGYVLYPGSDGEMVYGRLVGLRTWAGTNGPEVRLRIIPLKRSSISDGICAELQIPVVVKNWRNVVAVNAAIGGF
mgnify:FL=1